MTKNARYHAAVRLAEERRAQLQISIQSTRARLTPQCLKQDAKNAVGLMASKASNKVASTVRSRPIAFAAAGTALAAFILRRPITALFRRCYVTIQNRFSEN